MTSSRLKSLVLVSSLACAALASLAACAPLVIGGAATAALMVTDRRTTGTVVEDERIELRGGSLMREAFGDRAHVNVTSYNRSVLLTGEVPDAAAKQRAEQLVARIQNVKGVVNETAVLGTTTLAQRSNDVLITGKVKASLVDAADLNANAFRVVTERGIVYLMGLVTQREAERATRITRNVGGVQRVVRIFEYIGEDELRRSEAAAPARPASGSR
ncbi:MAG TPA: BON domain-containing protein [Ramlibacter sp.]|uniref:BON domain-containing protein n=1 Tax=Ramlibacter sp. TaxID=1917967 RepID=UPI002C232D0A|nr:BON domain-containing protein [Ramlibacter sp.]HVZ43925.1 BON domain-containing protein [Ramlibacter sp.]